MQRADRYGDTPLHVASAHGRGSVVEFLLEWQDERSRRLFSGKDVVAGRLPFKGESHAIMTEFMTKRLSPYDTQKFQKAWLSEVVTVYHKANNRSRYAPPRH